VKKQQKSNLLQHKIRNVSNIRRNVLITISQNNYATSWSNTVFFPEPESTPRVSLKK